MKNRLRILKCVDIYYIHASFANLLPLYAVSKISCPCDVLNFEQICLSRDAQLAQCVSVLLAAEPAPEIPSFHRVISLVVDCVTVINICGIPSTRVNSSPVE